MKKLPLAEQVLPGWLLILWQIGFQLLYGLLDDEIAADLDLSLPEQAWVGLAFLLPYASMQWRTGRMVDRWGARRLLALAALGCSLGAWLFSVADGLPMVFAGRFVTGLSAAFAFPAVAQLLRLSCNGRLFSLAMALLESCIGFGSAAVAMLLLWQPTWSWRVVTQLEALLVLGLGLWMLPSCLAAWRRRALPLPAEDLAPMGQRQLIRWGVVAAAAGVYAWEAGLVFAFGGFWSLWLERQHMLSAQEVTLSSLVLFLAVGVGTAVAGVLGHGSQQRCRFMVVGTTCGGITFLMLLLLPAAQQGRFHLLCMLLLGLSTAVGGLAFGEAGLAAPAQRVAQVIGLVNGIGCLTGGVFHVLPTGVMLHPDLQGNVLAWFGSLSLLGWLSALVLWRRSRAKQVEAF